MPHRLSSLLPKNILVIGDIILDRYIRGHVSRISPEAPVPVIRQQDIKYVLGGAGNVALNLSTMGANPILFSLVGEDHAACEIDNLCKFYNIKYKPIIESGRRTSIKTRVVATNQQLLRIDEEDDHDLSSVSADKLLSELIIILKTIDAVILSDYNKGLLTPNLINQIINLCANSQIPVFVDPKKNNAQIYKGATYIKPNKKELETISGIICNSSSSIAEAANKIIQETGSNVLVTLSSDGMIFFRNDNEVFSQKAFAREVFDVSGAGDTVISAMAYALANDYSITDAMMIANAASSVAVSKVGTSPVSFDEIYDELKRNKQTRSISNNTSINQNNDLNLISKWRAHGLKVGFTNGCFDLLHPGHISIINEATKHCNRLVVAINSDASVRRLKGESRPIQNQSSRASVISALSGVDMVVVFDEDTPLEIIKKIQPDVLIKGADYQEHEIIGADIIKANGGKIVRVDLILGHSTTGLVEKSKHGK